MSFATKSRLELIVLTLVACIGAFCCYGSHYCTCGHLAHGRHENFQFWIFDSLWLFALVGSAVVGLRGRFPGARRVGMACSILVVLMIVARSPLALVSILILGILLVVQVVELLGALIRNKRAEQAAS